MTLKTSDLAERLRHEFKGVREGVTRVLDVTVAPFDFGDADWVKVTLRLEPPADRDGWPVDDTQAIRRRAFTAVEDAYGDDPSPMVFVEFTVDPADVDVQDVAEDEDDASGDDGEALG